MSRPPGKYSTPVRQFRCQTERMAPHDDHAGPSRSAADPACAMAHGELAPAADGRTLVAVFASPVGRSLLHFARDAGFRTVLVEPEPDRVTEADRQLAGTVLTGPDATLLGEPDAALPASPDSAGSATAGPAVPVRTRHGARV